ncbi:MAG: anti-sigma factor [Vicinamibacterales bacterium]
MNDHVTDHLSAYLDGELGTHERGSVDAHLRACASCAAELEALRRLVQYAGTVAAHDRPPSRDLWSGIDARIRARHEGHVARFAGRPAHHGAAPRRVSFSVAGLVAAAVLLMAVSGTSAWLLRGRTPPAAPAAIVQAEVEPIASPADVRLVNFADAQYDAAVSDLELALEERRNDLHPRTVEILERNLKLIDAAIAQARQALEEDPGNTYLNRHLVESRRRKLDLLRRATAITGGD